MDKSAQKVFDRADIVRDALTGQVGTRRQLSGYCLDIRPVTGQAREGVHLTCSNRRANLTSEIGAVHFTELPHINHHFRRLEVAHGNPAPI
jgi:hypothetical protein